MNTTGSRTIVAAALRLIIPQADRAAARGAFGEAVRLVLGAARAVPPSRLRMATAVAPMHRPSASRLAGREDPNVGDRPGEIDLVTLPRPAASGPSRLPDDDVGARLEPHDQLQAKFLERKGLD